MAKKGTTNTNLENEEFVTGSTDGGTTSAEATLNETIPVIGIVTDCLRLNIRMKPNSGAKVLTEIDALSEVTIDHDKSTDEWYNICTGAGIEGFCMKKFVAVKQ